jgi:hypothetical protein
VTEARATIGSAAAMRPHAAVLAPVTQDGIIEA